MLCRYYKMHYGRVCVRARFMGEIKAISASQFRWNQTGKSERTEFQLVRRSFCNSHEMHKLPVMMMSI